MTRTQLTAARLTGDQPLAKPGSMADNECGTLHVRIEPYNLNPKIPTFVSRWILSEEQRQQIADGTHEILLSSLGSQPPMMLYTSAEFNEVDPTTGEHMDFTRWNPPYGWIYCGPDGEIHWSEKYDTHESSTQHRPATYLERWYFTHAGPPSEFGGSLLEDTENSDD